MRRFFLFAVFWAALFGSGHVLAACPMEAGTFAGVQADAQTPCHEAPAGDSASDTGHDCCAWVAPTLAASKAIAQKSPAPGDNVNPTAFVALALASGAIQPLTHPPPLIRSFSPDHAARLGSGTYLRTARLRL